MTRIGCVAMGSPFPEHGEQNVFFFGHVVQQFSLHFLQQVSQANRDQRVLAMHSLHPPSHADQFG